ncbi:signal recognition particle 19 kDa protein-like [Centruroides sculpturatus]|uniref:signal recognition particle 19 kDa protein-like n=1 Tax=Centruroides sculpturatus TaxID=218467 RepID=UPI000C6D6AEF|nr:signal recognition particle 19 kDa protein-like [Centruroides sculpturatus]
MASAWSMEKKHSDRERWVCLYPAYINSKKTVAEGRRIPKNKVNYIIIITISSRVNWIVITFDILKFYSVTIALLIYFLNIFSQNKMYPRELNHDNIIYRGRIRVQLKNDDGTPVNSSYPTRTSLMYYVSEMIPKLKTRTQKQGGGDQNQNPQNAAKKSKGKKGKR